VNIDENQELRLCQNTCKRDQVKKKKKKKKKKRRRRRKKEKEREKKRKERRKSELMSLSNNWTNKHRNVILLDVFV
jgi:ribosome-binding protein aMBF1 (putative translation factor)